MRMIDENGKELLEFDSAKGSLQPVEIFVRRHEAVEAVAEQGHFETVAEYPNGGKDVAWVVDVPGTEGRDAYDEYEQVLQFVPFTAVELAHQRIADLKQRLSSTDYQILKIVEGATTLQACAEIIRNRAAWRREINALEADLAKADE